MLTLTTTITGALSTFVLATEVVIVTDTLGLSSYWLGPFTAIIATGGILGTLFGARAVARLGSTTQPVAMFITAICYLGCVGNRSPVVLFLLLGVQSFAVGMTNVASASVRQRAIPADLRGRVGGLSRSFIFGCQVPGALLGGWLATQWGTDTMFAIAGVGLLILAAVTARALRHLLEPFQPTVPLGA